MQARLYKLAGRLTYHIYSMFVYFSLLLFSDPTHLKRTRSIFYAEQVAKSYYNAPGNKGNY